MSDVASKLTIPVKQADGTIVRMFLDEIKKMKIQPNNSSISIKNDDRGAAASVTAPAQSVIPKDTTVEVSEPKIIAIKEDNTETKEATPSLSKVEKVKNKISPPPIPPKPAQIVQDDADASPINKIIKESGVNIPADLTSRANSLIASRLKGVRDDEQFLTYALKSAGAGGLSLNQSQAEKILKFVKIYLETNTVKIIKPAATLYAKQQGNRTNVALQKKNTADYQLANTTPVTDIFLDEAKATMKNAVVASQRQVASSASRSSQSLSNNFNLASKLPIRPFQKSGGLIQDISEEKIGAGEKFTGPVDEMKSFTLKDWRRLAHKPSECAEIIFSKFTGWKEESFILYMDCRLAFAQSFLINEYRDALVQSINKNMPVRDILKSSSNKDSLTYDEFLAIGRLNAKLEV